MVTHLNIYDVPTRSKRLRKVPWGGGSTLNQARLCPPLAYGLIKKTHLILADGGLTDTQGQDHGGHRAERGAFDLRRIGEAFWR